MEKRVALFALGLGAAFALAFAVGSAFDPADTEAGPGHGMEATEMAVAAGLGVSEGAYTLRLDPGTFQTGESRQLRFRIEDAEGATVRDFDRRHERGAGQPADLRFTVSKDGEKVAGVESYRLFLQFKDGGRVHTAEFTVVAR